MDFELETVSPDIDEHIAEENIIAQLLYSSITSCVLCIIEIAVHSSTPKEALPLMSSVFYS